MCLGARVCMWWCGCGYLALDITDILFKKSCVLTCVLKNLVLLCTPTLLRRQLTA